jgi:serine/threonine protein phosphatase PrpC
MWEILGCITCEAAGLSRTEDQAEVAALLRDGVLSKTQARVYPRRNVITSYLSAIAKLGLCEDCFSVNEGDYVVTMTDGAYDIIAKAHVVQELKESSLIEEALERFRQRILMSGVKDNGTVIVVEI